MRNRSWQYRAVARRGVKYRAVFPFRGRRLCRGLILGLIWAFSLEIALAQRLTQPRRDRRSILLGGGVQAPAAPVALDPVLPRGEVRGLPLPLLKGESCSLKRPVCVVGTKLKEQLSTRAALLDLVRAYEEHSVGAGLPPPRASFRSPLRWILTDVGSLKLQVERVASRGFDRGRAMCRGGLPTLENARRCVTAAAIASTTPATASWLRDGYAAERARRMGPALELEQELESSRIQPQMGVLTSSLTWRDWRTGAPKKVSRLRSARFFSYLEERSLDQMGSAGWLALSLGATKTQAGASRYQAEPDMLDVLVATLRNDRTHLARLFDDFAGFTFLESQKLSPPIEPDWVLSSESLPRSVAFPFEIEPTGSVYLKLDFRAQEAEESVAFRIYCESPVSYVWSVIRLDASGNELSHVPITYRHRGAQADASVQPEPGTRSLLLVGTNMGGVALSHPFDPDHEPHEGHGCSVAVNVLPSELDAGSNRGKH